MKALVASTTTSGADVFIRLLFIMPIQLALTEAASPLVMNKMGGVFLTLRDDVRFTVCLFLLLLSFYRSEYNCG